MISKNSIIIYIRKFLIYIIAALFLFFLGGNAIYNYVFVVLLAVDIVNQIIIIIKDFGIFKLLIVIENLLIKAILITIFIVSNQSNLFADNILFQIFVSIVVLGLLVYPMYIIVFFVRTYKDEVIVVNKQILVVLLNGVVLFVLQFLVDTKYIGNEGYEYLLYFNFGYIMVVLYLPIVVMSFIYVANLFILDSAEKLKK